MAGYLLRCKGAPSPLFMVWNAMQLLFDAYSYFLENQARFWEGLGRHLNLSLSALAISVLVGLPLGIWIARRARAAQWVINFFGALRLVPSLAILFLTFLVVRAFRTRMR